MHDSPFKFLNAYEKEDVDVFFGREKETEELYEMTFDTNLMLVVGSSGTGKSSLIQCGLSNKFMETRWNDVYIKRERNINTSFDTVLDEELKTSGGIKFGECKSLTEKLENIYRATFKPIYLIFDQFEELFIINSNEEEQSQFFNSLQSIISASIPCKIIIIMRDEFTPLLWNFEKIVPNLFDHKYRVDKMRPANMKEVVSSTLDKMHSKDQLIVEDSEKIGEKVVESLTSSATGLELTYLQVYLDRLYRDAKLNNEGLPIISPSLVDQVEEFDDILESFLQDQMKSLEDELDLYKKEPIRILGEMITDNKTKRALIKAEQSEMTNKFQLSMEQLESCLKAYVNMRLIRQYDDGRIELTHDVLGPKIWDLLPAHDQQLRIITNSFNQRYSDYSEKRGSLLGAKEVNAWKEYFPLLDLTTDHKKFIDDSIKEIEKRSRNKRFIRAVLGILFVTAIVTSIWALSTRSNLEKKRNELVATNTDLEASKKNATELSNSLLSAFTELGNTQYALYYKNAIQAYNDTKLEDAEKLTNDAKLVISSIAEKMRTENIQDSLIASFQLSVDSNGIRADSLLKKIKINEKILDEFRNLANKGNQAEFRKNYLSAIQFYTEANQLMSTVSSRNKLQRLKDDGYQFYLGKAWGHKESKTQKDYEYALKALDHASKIYERDTLRILAKEIQDLISSK